MLFFALICATLPFTEPLTLNSETEQFVFEVTPEVTVDELFDKMTPFAGEQENLVIELSQRGNEAKYWNSEARCQGQFLGEPRSYEMGVSDAERADIRFIVTTLANKSLVGIAKSKNELECAGDRIDHVHPLLFLQTIFTDEELKAGIRNIRGKGWVWSQFTSGIKNSLTTEMSIGNINDEIICYFAQAVGLDPNQLYPFFEAGNWDGLIDFLIVNVPRRGDMDRYDS